MSTCLGNGKIATARLDARAIVAGEVLKKKTEPVRAAGALYNPLRAKIGAAQIGAAQIVE